VKPPAEIRENCPAFVGQRSVSGRPVAPHDARDARRSTPREEKGWSIMFRALLSASLSVAALLLVPLINQAVAAAPIKLAMFPFELEDFSAASQAGSAPQETTYLVQATEEAKQQLLQSGRYRLIDTAKADVSPAREKDLRNCNGCEAAIAKKLGADEAMLGLITKISMTEYVVRIQVRDAESGKVIASYGTGLRMGADYSWPRGVRWLMQKRLLTSK
jgi:hypothetical protein